MRGTAVVALAARPAGDVVTSRGWRLALLPLVPILAVAAYLVWVFVVDHDGEPARVDVRSSGPEYATLSELAHASDRVVEGQVVALDDGRAISDPSDPSSGITTQLATIDLTRVIKGPATDVIVVEQESGLLDGTPITVNGVAPLAVGDSGWFFLVDGDGEQFPYTALTVPDAFVAADSPRAADMASVVAAG